jgi:luciferase family oxidoreductase group 1
MVPLSILDLAPIIKGSDARTALDNSVDLAQHAERLGYRRFWLAEHHNMPGIASAATSIAIAHVAAGTKTIRVGAGGIMLPNHAPLIVAEQFGTLASLYPGRIDLGVGRAPGTDPLTMRALRRNLAGDVDSFPDDVIELMRFLSDEELPVRAIPGRGTHVPIWILGSSTFGAQLAAALGLPYAFALHFAPAEMMRAIDIYRARFKASEQLDKPYVMLGVNAFVADTDEQARVLLTSLQQAFINLRRGRPTELPPPNPHFELGPVENAMLESVLSCSIVGSPATAKKQLDAFVAKTNADELIATAMIFDHAARVRSFDLLSQVAFST